MKHHCPNCDADFEGNFCPECGYQAKDEKVCPKCGTGLPPAAKFCSACGFSFVAASAPQPAPQPAPMPAAPAPQPAPAAQKESAANVTVKKVYSLLGSLPALLSLLFSAALFLFYLAPVAISPSVFGEPATSFGNVYQCLNGIVLSLGEGLGEIQAATPELKGAMIALIVFAAVMTLFSFIWSLTKPQRRSPAYSLIGGLLWLALLIISAVAMATVNGHGIGIIVAGAALQLILAFSVVYLVAEVGALVGVRVLYRRYEGLEAPAKFSAKQLSLTLYGLLRVLPVLYFTLFSASLFLIFLAPTAHSVPFEQFKGFDFAPLYMMRRDPYLFDLFIFNGSAHDYEAASFMLRGLYAAFLSFAVCMTVFSVGWIIEKVTFRRSEKIYQILSGVLALGLLITEVIFASRILSNSLRPGVSVLLPMILSAVYLVVLPLSHSLTKTLASKKTVSEHNKAEEERIAAWQASHEAPVKKPRPPKPEAPASTPLSKRVLRSRRLLIASNFLFFFAIFGMLTSIGLSGLFNEDVGEAMYELVIAGAALMLLGILLGIPGCVSKYGKGERKRKIGWTVFRTVVSFIGIIPLTILPICFSGADVDLVFIITLFFGDLLFIISFIVHLVAIIQYKKTSRVASASEEYRLYCEQYRAYAEALREWRRQDPYLYECVCYERGKEYRRPNGLVLFYGNRRAVAIVLLAIVAVGCCVLAGML